MPAWTVSPDAHVGSHQPSVLAAQPDEAADASHVRTWRRRVAGQHPEMPQRVCQPGDMLLHRGLLEEAAPSDLGDHGRHTAAAAAADVVVPLIGASAGAERTT